MKNYSTIILLFIITLGYVPNVLSYDKDSIFVESLFNDLLGKKRDSSEVYAELERLRNRLDKHELLNWLVYNEAKYYLFTGYPERTEELSLMSIRVLSIIDSRKSCLKFYALLASSYSFRQDYEKGIFYFKKALELAEIFNLELQVAYLHNNIANVFFSLLDYEAAHYHAEKSISILNHYKHDPNYASILAVLSVSKAKINHLDNAEKLALEAREIAGKESNYKALVIAIHALGEIEMNRSNYKQAYDYFDESLTLSERFQLYHFSLLNYIGLLNSSIELGLYKKAVIFGNNALAQAANIKNNSTLYSINRHLSRAYEGTGNYQQAFRFATTAHDIFLETNKKETQKAINNLLIQYDSEKKEKEIAASRVKLLNSDIKASRLLNFLMLIAFAFLIIGIAFLIYRARVNERIYGIQAANRKELFNALIRGEERERIRMGNELHDGLASRLIGIKYHLETATQLTTDFKNEIVEKINIAHSETRRIAHNLAPAGLVDHGLLCAIEQFAKDNSANGLAIYYTHVGKSDFVMKKNSELILFRIVQELVQNALKHAKASSIFIQTSFNEPYFTLQVENDGQGFDPNNIKTGSGLKSVYNRLRFLNASFSVDSSQESNGAVVYISLPLS